MFSYIGLGYYQKHLVNIIQLDTHLTSNVVMFTLFAQNDYDIITGFENMRH